MRSCTLPSPNVLRITQDGTATEYKIEIWQVGPGVRSVELTRIDTGTTYTILVREHRNPRCGEWRCNCPSSRYRAQCKHVLALKAGLRTVGVKV